MKTSQAAGKLCSDNLRCCCNLWNSTFPTIRTFWYFTGVNALREPQNQSPPMPRMHKHGRFMSSTCTCRISIPAHAQNWPSVGTWHHYYVILSSIAGPGTLLGRGNPTWGHRSPVACPGISLKHKRDIDTCEFYQEWCKYSPYFESQKFLIALVYWLSSIFALPYAKAKISL